MDYTAWRFWFDVLQFLLTGAIGVYVWAANRERVSAKRLTDLTQIIDERLDNHDRRIATVENECEHSPKHADLGQVYDRINAVSGNLSDLTGEMRAVRRSVDMIHQHLLNERGN